MDTMSLTEGRVRASWEAAGQPGRVLIAYSGGADSTALLLALCALRRERGISLFAAHVHHGLRERAEDDAAFALAQCKRLSVPAEVLRVTVGKEGGVEAAAREARYSALFAQMRATGAQTLALAHHAGDQLETALMRLARGGGATGLSGMREYDKARRLWRPLLSLTKEELLAYLGAQNAAYCEDETNRNPAFARNALRLCVIPALRSVYPECEHAAARACALLSCEEDCWQAFTEDFLAKHARREQPCAFVLAQPFEKLHLAKQRRIVRAFVPTAMEARHVDDVISLQNGQSANLPGGYRALRTATRLHLLSPMRESFCGHWTLSEAPFEGDHGDGVRSQSFPKRALEGAVLRTRQPGDIIRPFGTNGSQTLKEYMIDRKLDMPFRAHWPVLARGNEALWVIGMGASEAARAQADEATIFLRFEGTLPDDTNENNNRRLLSMEGMMTLYNDLDEILLTKEQLAEGVRALGARISADYAGKSPVLVCILKGAVTFFADLMREINLPVSIDFMAISSYGSSTKSSGVVRILKDLDKDVLGKDVIVVEDIVDSGLTLSYITTTLKGRGAASVCIAALLDKPARRKVPLTVQYSCFNIPDAFVVGYGLDYDEKYRNLPEVGVLSPRIYNA